MKLRTPAVNAGIKRSGSGEKYKSGKGVRASEGSPRRSTSGLSLQNISSQLFRDYFILIRRMICHKSIVSTA
jgi:hypothetical protein